MMEPTASDLEPLQQQQQQQQQPHFVDDENLEDDKQKHWWKDRNLWTRIWQGIAIASFSVNIVAMAIEGSTVAIIAGVVAVLIAPVVFWVQFKLQEEGSK